MYLDIPFQASIVAAPSGGRIGEVEGKETAPRGDVKASVRIRGVGVSAAPLLVCLPCEAGSFKQAAGSAKCEVCPAGMYQVQHTATNCNILLHTDTRRHTATHSTHTATHCNALQHTATHCNTLQHTATNCNTL